MARENNFLLGSGEKLTAPVDIDGGAGDKNPPYDFGTALGRIVARLRDANRLLSALPQEACPDDRVVALLTMHPRYISKSDYPVHLLDSVGLQPVGSRSKDVTPEVWGTKTGVGPAVTEQIFVEGRRAAFAAWQSDVATWNASSPEAKDLTHVEDVAAFAAGDKVRSLPSTHGEAVLEVALHNANDGRIFDQFAAYATRLGARVMRDRRRDVKGLTFVPVEAQVTDAVRLAEFAFVRVIRGMPSIRPFRPGIVRSVGAFPVTLPTGPAVDEKRRVLVLDGGIPQSVDLSRWVTAIEPPRIGPPDPMFQEHGLAVTSAILFGPLEPGTPAPRPLAPVHHVRVLDARTGRDADYLYSDVLERVMAALAASPGKYDFVNISIGPNLAVNDDEVTAWTASLDDFFAEHPAVVTVAAGNDGELDAATGNNRVQPPGDGVNVLTVGACDSSGAAWRRASYSSTGPGRSPGVVKPDGISFGGCDGEPFMVLSPLSSPTARGLCGTSFAAPYALRTIVGGGVQLGSAVNPLALRALMIHRADPAEHSRVEVGWGRFEDVPQRLVTCEDDEVVVLYQGVLPLGQHLRAAIPLAPDMTGMVEIAATLLVAPEVDPEHPGAYTRAGFEVAFRPTMHKLRKNKDKTLGKQPKTKALFGEQVYESEFQLRADGHKWEPCRRESTTCRATSLENPVLDVYYHHRMGGSRAVNPRPIPYALVVGVRAPRVTDLYARTVREYQSVLVPLQPEIRIPVRT